jgi:hypothetical protein
MSTYEYRIVRVTLAQHKGNVEEELNKLGADGFNLVTALPETAGEDATFVFEREVKTSGTFRAASA